MFNRLTPLTLAQTAARLIRDASESDEVDFYMRYFAQNAICQGIALWGDADFMDALVAAFEGNTAQFATGYFRLMQNQITSQMKTPEACLEILAPRLPAALLATLIAELENDDDDAFRRIQPGLADAGKAQAGDPDAWVAMVAAARWIVEEGAAA